MQVHKILNLFRGAHLGLCGTSAAYALAAGEPEFEPVREFISGGVRLDGTEFCETQLAFDSLLAVRMLDGHSTLMLRREGGAYVPLRDFCSLAPSWELYLCTLIVAEARQDGTDDTARDGWYFPASLEMLQLLGHHFPPYVLLLWGRPDAAGFHAQYQAQMEMA